MPLRQQHNIIYRNLYLKDSEHVKVHVSEKSKSAVWGHCTREGFDSKTL